VILISEERLNYYDFFFLSKMLSKGKIGHKKVILTDMLRGIPSHERGFVEKAYHNLKKKDFFWQTSRRSGDPYFSIYPDRLAEINSILDKNSCPNCRNYLDDLNFCEKCQMKISRS
jgi:hypothetical protein